MTEAAVTVNRHLGRGLPTAGAVLVAALVAPGAVEAAGGAGALGEAQALEGREAPEGAGVRVEAGVHAEAPAHEEAPAHAEAPARALAGAQVRGLAPATPRGPVAARARERRRPAVHPASGRPREVAAGLGLVVHPAVGMIVPMTGLTKDPDRVPTSFQTLSRIDNVRSNYAKCLKQRGTRGSRWADFVIFFSLFLELLNLKFLQYFMQGMNFPVVCALLFHLC